MKLRRKLLKVTPLALEEYRENVKGNKRMPKLDVRKKLTRNVLLAELSSEKDGVKTYRYGNLVIAVEDNVVIAVVNRKGKSKTFNKDKQRYYELNKELQIRE